MRTANLPFAYGLRGTLPAVALQGGGGGEPFYILRKAPNDRLLPSDSPFEMARAEMGYAVVAVGYVGHHRERAAPMMRELGHLSGRIGVSRFHRRLHPLADGMSWIPANVGGASPRATGSLSIDSPCRSAVVCAPGTFGRHRARILRGVRGETGEGLWTACASDPPPAASASGRVQMLPAGGHDLTPVHEPAYDLPAGARPLGDKVYNSAADEAASRRRRGCARFRCAGRPCVRTPGVWTPSKCVRIIVASR